MHIFITYRQKLEGKTNRTVLDEFKENFENSNCDHVEIIDDRSLVVKNDFFRFRSRNNIWSTIRYAEVVIQDSIKLGAKEVLYKIDILRFIIMVFFLLLFLNVFDLVNQAYESLIEGSLMFLVIFFISFLILYFRHRFLFVRTMKSGIL